MLQFRDAAIHRGPGKPPSKPVRAARAEALVQIGELSSARQALEGAEVAPGNRTTLGALRKFERRPPNLRDPLPEELINFQPATLFQLDEDRFLKNLRSSRRGAAAGPSGMTNEHLRPLLNDVRGVARSLNS